MPGLRVTAASLLRDYEGRVLLIGSQDGWSLPGAVSEDDETPLETAERGLAEAAGVHRRPGHLLVVDCTAGTLTFLFDGGRLDDVSEALPGSQARFADVSELDGLVPPEIGRAIATAVSETGDAYAENGLNPAAAGPAVAVAEEF